MALKPPIARFAGQVTSFGVATELTISNVSPRGYITRIHAKHISGTSAANLQPVLGNVANPEGGIGQILLVAASSGLHIDEVPSQKIPFITDSDGNLYLRFKPDGGSTDHTIDFELYIEPGF
jgi:hypothetical protein